MSEESAAPKGESSFAREARALARQGSLMLRAIPRRRRRLDGERVVVFVHGFLAAGAGFDPMRIEVEDALGLPTLDYTYGPLATFEDVVARLEAHIDAHVPAHATLSLVGHSLGGIVARSYLHELEQEHRVDRVITIATPHAGTVPARYAPSGLAQAQVIRPGSEVLRRLREHRERALHIPHVAIVAGQDKMCFPPESAAAIEHADVHRFDDLGHNEILYDRRVIELVARSLV
jgi:triacylglycerol lipase